jgi:hypothetical protein
MEAGAARRTMRGMSTYAHHIPLQASYRDDRPVPRWANTAAHLVAFTTLPSALWRLPLAFGFSMGALEPNGAPVHVTGWESVYVLSLSLVSEAAALLTLGLVRPWGERAPSWFPLIGGRRLRPLAVIVPAAVGAVLLALIWGFAFRDFPDMDQLEFSHTGWKVLLVAAYAPLLAWAPLLAAVTYAYWRRRCRD